MKVGIITVATGERHNNLCRNFLKSLYTHFDQLIEKKVCVIGDDNSYLDNNEIYHRIVNLPSPLITLLRFNFINQVAEQFKDCDFVFYFDSDMEIISQINISEILPDQTQITVVKHPWAKSDQNGWIVEQNKCSTAAIDNVKEYYQGCFFGASRDVFFSMTQILSENVTQDLRNRYIALWFDESHLNKYVHDKPRKVVEQDYAQPTQCELRTTTKILHKNAFTNH
jgi:hypothetical protein